MTVCLLCVSIHIMFPSGQGLTASYVSNNFPDTLYRSHLMSPHVISVYVPFHLRLLAGIGATTKIDSRQGGSQNRIPTQWVWGIGCLNKYESLGYFFFQSHFQSEKQDILAERKVPKSLCILPPQPQRTVGWDIQNPLPLEYPSGTQHHSKSEGPQETHGPLYPKLNTFLEGERISQSPGPGFSSVPILFLLLALIKTCWVCFEDKVKNNITLF